MFYFQFFYQFLLPMHWTKLAGLCPFSSAIAVSYENLSFDDMTLYLVQQFCPILVVIQLAAIHFSS